MRTNKHLNGVILALVICSIVHAQDSLPYSTLSVNAGISRVADKDLFQSPYTYRGNNLLLHTSYIRYSVKGQHSADLRYSGGQVASIVSPKANYRLLQFNYGYLFNMGQVSANRKFVPSLGVGIHTMMRTVNYLPKIASPSNYLTAAGYFTVRGNMTWNIHQKSNLKIQATLPVAGLVYRPDFAINGKTLTKVSAPGKTGLFTAGLEYSYPLTPNLHLAASYTYSYFSFDEPRPVTILQNRFSVGLLRKF